MTVVDTIAREQKGTIGIKEEITQAVKSLGYPVDKHEVNIKTLSYNRVTVTLDEKRLGIYDIDKHTFVD